MKFEEVSLINPGLLCAEMPEETYQVLLESCEKQIKAKSTYYAMKRHLVTDNYVQGIEEMIAISIPPSYNQYLLDLALEYSKYFKMNIGNLTPKVKESWLNLQKKHEYRPVHAHSDNSGKNLSFVTYIKIPYELKEEDSYSNHNKKAGVFRNGRIEFFYNNFAGSHISALIDIDKTYQGKTLIFLNNFRHAVYPFYTSDEYRISLAGNINFQ